MDVRPERQAHQMGGGKDESGEGRVSVTDGAGLPAEVDMTPLHERDERAGVVSGGPHGMDGASDAAHASRSRPDFGTRCGSGRHSAAASAVRSGLSRRPLMRAVRAPAVTLTVARSRATAVVRGQPIRSRPVVRASQEQ